MSQSEIGFAPESAEPYELDDVFGPGQGTTPAERARQSTIRFVRSQTGIAHDSPEASGLKMSAIEAYQAFGWDVLRQMPDRPNVAIVRSGFQAKEVLPKARAALGLTREALAARAGVSLDDLIIVEEGRRRMSMAILAKIAIAIGHCPIRFGAVESARPALPVQDGL